MLKNDKFNHSTAKFKCIRIFTDGERMHDITELDMITGTVKHVPDEGTLSIVQFLAGHIPKSLECDNHKCDAMVFDPNTDEEKIHGTDWFLDLRAAYAERSPFGLYTIKEFSELMRTGKVTPRYFDATSTEAK